MNFELKKPLIFFDLETTGTKINEDRIVEIATIKIFPNGEIEEKCKRINPTIPIPEEVSLIHGIYDKDVKDEPTFKNIAKTLEKYFEGCNLGGYNIIKFDLPLLVEEFLRVDIDFKAENRKIIDCQKIFFLMEKRNLGAALEFYCNKKLENAHNAMSDTKATFEVFLAQLEKYNGSEVTDLLGEKLGTMDKNIENIHKITHQNIVDFAGRMTRNRKGEIIFNFGKYKGQTVKEIFSKDPNYYEWMMNADFTLDTKKKLTQIKLSLL